MRTPNKLGPDEMELLSDVADRDPADFAALALDLMEAASTGNERKIARVAQRALRFAQDTLHRETD